MFKSGLITIMLFFASPDSGAANLTCPQAMEGKHSCRMGETMKCIKKFDPESHAFKYELDGVNAHGQSFGLNSPMYKKTPGYTPAPCSDSHISK